MDRATRRRAYGTALKNARLQQDRYTQVQLADAVGVKQGSVTDWERGVSEPDPVVAAAVEELLEVAPGTLTRHLGYLPLRFGGATMPPSAIDVILTDPALDDQDRTAMLGMYRALTRHLGGRR